MIPALLESLADGWDWSTADPPTSAALLGPDRAADAKVTLLLFAWGGEPVAVAKVARSAVGAEALRREHDALCAFWTPGSAALRSRMPRPLGLRTVGAHRVLLQSAVAGRPMTLDYYTPGHVSSAARVRADFAAGAEWLAMFQAETAAGRLPADEVVEEHIRPLLASYAGELGWGAAEDAVFGEALGRVRDLPDATLPLAGEHGDFWMGNLMVESPGWVTAVVDWEHARRSGSPMSDVLKFPTSYAFYLDRGRPWAGGRVRGHPERTEGSPDWERFGDWRNLLGFRHAYFTSGWFPEVVREHVTAARRRLDVPPALTLLLMGAFLVEQALLSHTEEFRQGYRSLVAALAAEGRSSWLWADD